MSKRGLRASYFRRLYSTNVNRSVNSEHSQHVGVYDANKIADMYPLDPRTGLPMTDLGRLLDPNTSTAAKENVMSRLQRQEGTFLPKGMTDKEAFDITPPRHILRDEVEVQKWREHVADDVLPNMSDPVKEGEANQGEGVEPTNE